MNLSVCVAVRVRVRVFECVHAYMWVFEKGIAGIAGKRAYEELAHLVHRLNDVDKLRSGGRSGTYQRCKTVG